MVEMSGRVHCHRAFGTVLGGRGRSRSHELLQTMKRRGWYPSESRNLWSDHSSRYQLKKEKGEGYRTIDESLDADMSSLSTQIVLLCAVIPLRIRIK